jgi:hypothetical protein
MVHWERLEKRLLAPARIENGFRLRWLELKGTHICAKSQPKPIYRRRGIRDYIDNVRSAEKVLCSVV